MFSAFANTLRIPELRTRLLFTLGIIFVCRIVSMVPLPFIDGGELQAVIDSLESDTQAGVLSFIDLFSGGALTRCAVGALGIMPYISASIILQLMTAIIPTLERLAREGEVGRQTITQYTRYLTLGICIIQGYALAVTLENPAALGINAEIVTQPGPLFRIMAVIAVTAATMLLMWLGEQITERGVGNGTSMVITIGIVSDFPGAVYRAWSLFRGGADGGSQFTIFELVILIAMFLAVTAGTIMLTQGQRKIPIHTTKRVIGRKVYAAQNTYMPLRVNYSGVMPIIFASSLLVLPMGLLKWMGVHWDMRWCLSLSEKFGMNDPLYLISYALLILFFSYFWVATQFNPLQISDDLKRNGGYIPGYRPGRPTAEFLDTTMSHLTLVGAIFLTIIAVIPSIMSGGFHVPWTVASFFGGTSLLIVVGVTLDTMRQVESFLLMRHYDGFLKKGRLRGRY